jgi:hypothetical protein
MVASFDGAAPDHTSRRTAGMSVQRWEPLYSAGPGRAFKNRGKKTRDSRLHAAGFSESPADLNPKGRESGAQSRERIRVKRIGEKPGNGFSRRSPARGNYDGPV